MISGLGAAYGTAKSGIGIASMGVLKPEAIMKSIIPIVMAGILGIYGLIVAVILLGKIDENYTTYYGYKHFVAGICCGFSALVFHSYNLSGERPCHRSCRRRWS